MATAATAGGGGITRTLDSNLTLFSAAEIRVAIITVGDIPEDCLATYVSLITKHRQVELTNVQSFYTPVGEQKTPFKYFPWRTGCMHFKYLGEEGAAVPSPLSTLYWHRKVLGIICICHCPTATDLVKEYQAFQQACRAHPDAFAVRFFAFNPTEAHVEADKRTLRNFVMIPPGSLEHLAYHTEVMMHDFAACLLAELERWLLAASVNLFTLNTFVDSAEFTGATAFEDFSNKLRQDDDMALKRRYARLQKAQGDVALLAGSPADAFDHYTGAIDLARVSNDAVWLAAALEGRVTAKLVDIATTQGAVRQTNTSAFTGEGMRSTNSLPTEATTSETDIPTLAAQSNPPSTTMGSTTSVGSGGGFGGRRFWQAMRSAAVEEDVCASLADAKRELRRKGALPLQVELELKLARFLVGMHGTHARGEVNEMVSGLVELAGALSLSEDRLAAVVEAAQVVGAVGLARKRTLMLWQAVELSKSMERPDGATLEIAKKALEPVELDTDASSSSSIVKRRGIVQAAVPLHWGTVRTGCIEGVLALAIRARQHVEVWDCASMLLREQYTQLSTGRQMSLLETLSAAATQMSASEKQRPGPGPPPLISFVRAVPLAEPFRPALLWSKGGGGNGGAGGGGGGAGGKARGPFIYDPYSDKRQQEQEALRPCQWVCGEMATVEVDVYNPTTVGFKVDRLAIDAQHVGRPGGGQGAAHEVVSVGVGENNGAAGGVSAATTATTTTTIGQHAPWKPMPTSLRVPALTAVPTRLQLIGAPAAAGTFVLTGCRVSTFGVTWHQPWAPKRATQATTLIQQAKTHQEEPAASPAMRVSVVPPLPLLMATIDRGTTTIESQATSPPRSPTAGDRRRNTRRVSAYHGERLTWSLVLENIGKQTIERMRIQGVVGHHHHHQGRGKRERQGRRGGRSYTQATVTVAPHEDVVLTPGQETRVPVQVHVGEGVEVNAEVVVEYVGAYGAAEEAAVAGGHGVVGRRLKVPVAIRMQPLVRVAGVRVVPWFDANRKLECVVEVDVVAVMGESVEGDSEQAGYRVWLGTQRNDGHAGAEHDSGVLTTPDERVTVRRPVEGLLSPLGSNTTALEDGTQPVDSILHEHCLLHWAAPDGRCGAVHLPRESVALDDAAVALLRGHGACTTVRVCGVEETICNGEPVVRAGVGDVLQVECCGGSIVIEGEEHCAALAGVLQSDGAVQHMLDVLCVHSGTFCVRGVGGARYEWVRVEVAAGG